MKKHGRRPCNVFGVRRLAAAVAAVAAAAAASDVVAAAERCIP